MDRHNLICKHQFGFQSQHSTQHAVISLVNNITNSLDSSNIVIGVFLDLKKAFDTVDHTILLKKLYAYGIRDKAHKCPTSYLTGRTQYVIYDGHKSSTLNMTCGVPQGSILGTLLFIIYVNDIFFWRRRFIVINKQYIQDSRKERYKEHSENNNEERKRDKPEAAIVYSYAKLSGIDLIERFSLYSDQNQIFECKIKIKQGRLDNNGFHGDINKYPII